MKPPKIYKIDLVAYSCIIPLIFSRIEPQSYCLQIGPELLCINNLTLNFCKNHSGGSWKLSG
jgi:hypothetical protein